jgi:hypothetical protein
MSPTAWIQVAKLLPSFILGGMSWGGAMGLSGQMHK